jgi:hypothetical protein
MNIVSDIHKVVPLSLQVEIDELRDQEGGLAWRYGRLANEVYHYVVANGLPYTRLEACGYLAYSTDNQRAPTTILRYAMVDEFFSNKPVSKERYAFLPFSHFELAMQCGADWLKVLKKSIRMMDENGGRLPSRAKLEAALRPDRQAISLTERLQYREPTVILTFDEGEDDMTILQNILAALQIEIKKWQIRHPEIATPLAQVVLLIQQTLEKVEYAKTKQSD